MKKDCSRFSRSEPEELNLTTTIIFQRSKTIGSKIFNYKKVVQNVITNNYQVDSINFPACNCDSSPFVDPNHGHIVTNNLGVIDCKELRSLLMKGPKYREPQNVNWDYFMKHFKTNLTDYLQTRVNEIKSSEINFQSCEEYYNKVLKDIKTSIEKIKKRKRFYRKMRLTIPKIKETLAALQEKFVFVPTDKAGNNIAIICKKFYIIQSMKELGILGIEPQVMRKSVLTLRLMYRFKGSLNVIVNTLNQNSNVTLFLTNSHISIGFQKCIKNLLQNNDILLPRVSVAQNQFLKCLPKF